MGENSSNGAHASYEAGMTPITDRRASSSWRSRDISLLTRSLIDFQGKLTSIKQDKINPFFNSKYVDINTVLTAVRPLLSEHKLAITQGNRYCERTNGFYVTTTLLHVSGNWIRSEVRMPVGGKKDAHAVGGAITYGRRYGLLSMLGIAVEGDDDDGNSNAISKTQHIINESVQTGGQHG